MKKRIFRSLFWFFLVWVSLFVAINLFFVMLNIAKLIIDLDFWKIIIKAKLIYSIPISLVGGIICFLFNFFLENFKNSKIMNLFSNSKISNEDISKSFLIDQRNKNASYKDFNERIDLNSENAGVVVHWKKERNKFMWWTLPESHIKVLGTTGSFKSWFFILSNIYRNLNDPNLKKRPNMVIIDPKGELYENSVKMNRRLENYNLIRLDFTDAKSSLKWNPLSQIWDLYMSDDSDDQNLATNKIQDFLKAIPSLDENSTKGDAIWPLGARKLLTSIILFMLEYYKNIDREKFNKEYFNLMNVYKLVADVNKFKKLIDTYSSLKNPNNPENYLFPKLRQIRDDVAFILDAADSTKMSYQGNAAASISQFVASKTMWEILYKNELDFHSFLEVTEKPTAFYITYPDDQPAIFPLVSIVVSQVYQAALEVARKNKKKGKGEKLDRTLQLFIDEFGILPKLPNFENWINIARSRNIAIIVAYQSEEQLSLQYEKERKIIEDGFSASLLLSTSSLETAKKYSELIGQVEVSKESKSYSTKNQNKQTSSSISLQKEAVISPNDIMTLPKTQYLLVMNNQKPSILNKSFVFKEMKSELNDEKENEITRRVRLIKSLDILNSTNYSTNPLHPQKIKIDDSMLFDFYGQLESLLSKVDNSESSKHDSDKKKVSISSLSKKNEIEKNSKNNKDNEEIQINSTSYNFSNSSNEDLEDEGKEEDDE